MFVYVLFGLIISTITHVTTTVIEHTMVTAAGVVGITLQEHKRTIKI